MSRRCLVVNLDRCSGCDSCITACKYENDLTLGEYWNHVVAVGPTGTFPDVEMYWLPVFCQQCENPGCINVCPTGASYRDPETGVVLVDKEKCIGCKYCMMACPYGVRHFNEQEGYVEKCTLCSQLTASGEDIPVCCHNCPTGARFFGDLDDPESDASVELARYSDDCIHALPDPGDAHPTTRYILSPKIAEWKELI